MKRIRHIYFFQSHQAKYNALAKPKIIKKETDHILIFKFFDVKTTYTQGQIPVIITSNKILQSTLDSNIFRMYTSRNNKQKGRKKIVVYTTPHHETCELNSHAKAQKSLTFM